MRLKAFAPEKSSVRLSRDPRLEAERRDSRPSPSRHRIALGRVVREDTQTRSGVSSYLQSESDRQTDRQQTQTMTPSSRSLTVQEVTLSPLLPLNYRQKIDPGHAGTFQAAPADASAAEPISRVDKEAVGAGSC